MSETMTPQEAVETLARASRWEGSLAQRTEGLTWMIWGLAMAGMFVSYGLADALDGEPIMPFLWAPWVIAGNLLTWALWRTAALHSTEIAPMRERRRWWAVAAVFLGVFGVMTWVMPPQTWAVPMILTGAVWSFMGLLIPRMSRQGRVVSACVGVGVALAAIALVLLRVPEPVGGTLATALVGGIPLAGGLWQVLRG